MKRTSVEALIFSLPCDNAGYTIFLSSLSEQSQIAFVTFKNSLGADCAIMLSVTKLINAFKFGLVLFLWSFLACVNNSTPFKRDYLVFIVLHILIRFVILKINKRILNPDTELLI